MSVTPKTPQPQVSVTYRDGQITATVTCMTQAAPGRVWDVMSDHPGYADVASNISRVEVVSGNGADMQRKCYGPKGESWSETCTHFEDQKSFGFRVHTEAADYPYPFAAVAGRWSLEPVNDGTRFSILITVVPKGGALARYGMYLVSKRQFAGILTEIANRWAARMERAD